MLFSAMAGPMLLAADGSFACSLDLDDGGDSNPFTYGFAALDAPADATFTWDFGDSTGGSGATVSHTYATTGTFTISLTCTPLSGDPIVLSGSIYITSTPVASFTITPGTSGYTPFTIQIVDASTGGGLSYQWTSPGRRRTPAPIPTPASP